MEKVMDRSWHMMEFGLKIVWDSVCVFGSHWYQFFGVEDYGLI